MIRSAKGVPEDSLRRLGLAGKGDEREGFDRLGLTDLGNAERFAKEHGDRVRYCHPWSKWLEYDGGRYSPDDSGSVERMMQSTVRDIYAEAAKADDHKERKAIADHARRSEAKKRITDALYLARSLPDIPVLPKELDADPWMLNAANGTVDLRTRELRAHRPDDLLTKMSPVAYDPEAEAPTFEKFVETILPAEALRSFVQRAFGYSATGTVSEEVLIICHGRGSNGKTTLVNAAMEALGDYAMQAAPGLLLAKRGSHPTELADLFGARFVSSAETDEGRRLAEGLAKQLTGRDPIKARRMREDFWQFNPTHTVFLATNHRPEVRGTDHAIWRRIKLVPFDVTIPDAEQDKHLAEKLRAELPGILRWIVEGCREYLRDGLGEPEEVRAATAGYRADMDPLTAFIADRCIEREGAWAKFADLYSAYKDWSDESGEKAETKRLFGARLKERGFEPEKGTGNVSIRRGIGLLSAPGGGPDGPPRVTTAKENYPTKNGENPHENAENTEDSYRSYPKSDMNDNAPPHEWLYTTRGNAGNLGNSGGDDDYMDL